MEPNVETIHYHAHVNTGELDKETADRRLQDFLKLKGAGEDAEEMARQTYTWTGRTSPIPTGKFPTELEARLVSTQANLTRVVNLFAREKAAGRTAPEQTDWYEAFVGKAAASLTIMRYALGEVRDGKVDETWDLDVHPEAWLYVDLDLVGDFVRFSQECMEEFHDLRADMFGDPESEAKIDHACAAAKSLRSLAWKLQREHFPEPPAES